MASLLYGALLAQMSFGVSEHKSITRILSVGAQVTAMVSLQYGATLAKGLFSAVGAEGTTLLRLGIGAMILALVMRPWRAKLSLRIAPALIGYGATLASMNLLFYVALKTIPLGIAAAIQFSGPLLVATLASRRKLDFAWIGLAVIGLLLVSPPVPTIGPLDSTGVFFALASAASWALYIVFGQKVGKELGSHAAAIGMLIGAIVLLPIGIPHLQGEGILTPTLLLQAAIIGFLSCALPFSLEMVALTHLPARMYGTLTSMEPVIGALMGLLFLHEILTLLQWLGVLAVVAAALGTAITMRAPGS